MPDNQFNIHRFQVEHNRVDLKPDVIAVEEPMQILLSHRDKLKPYGLTMRTPGNDIELIYGLLLTEGIICSAQDINTIEQEPLSPLPQRQTNGVSGLTNQYIVNLRHQLDIEEHLIQPYHMSYSGCGLCGKTSLQALDLKPKRNLKKVDFQLSHQLIKQLKNQLARQPLFSKTGGVHAAGLIYYQDDFLDIENAPFFEDIGRHNALDKLIGYELIKHDLQQSGILVLSGRIGFELVQKAVMAGFAMIVALGAPSHLAIQAANQFDIVLVGFAKDTSFNLYTAHKNLLNDSVAFKLV
ncbi:formate dehydrogenase accessory sulfurtransferase FdhD [Aliikangiella maris]|uniref:Sulfur carrier protein FdhD n=2 Tax=Aliikangiella maris TaxID=3162458 RepID=A0ABV2BZ24_9GAMM